jgi:capsular polysaccharide export protein
MNDMNKIDNVISMAGFHPELQKKMSRRRQSGKVLLFLQCPIGPIAQELLSAAEKAGYTPVKMNFNSGDALYVRDEYSINFRGRPDDWGPFFDYVSQVIEPEAIVLMGDMRFYHKVAIDIARTRGIRVICLEEGYMRPNFVTVELGGNNSNSPLRKNFPAEYKAAGASGAERQKPVRVNKAIGQDMFWTVVSVSVYYAAKVLGGLRFRYYQHHRKRAVLSEIVSWIFGYGLKVARSHRNKTRLLSLVEHRDKQFFVVALQVHDDLQLICHGRGWSNQLLIAKSIVAFAASAAETHHLVVKGHPLDRGRYHYKELVLKLSRLAGCENRVHFVDDGSISLMIRHSLGLVTINSTSGISALHHRKPMLALGDALYSIEGLVNPASGDDCIQKFFTDPINPDPDMAQAFLDSVEQHCLVNGSFYHRGELKFTARNIIEKISKLLASGRSNDIV